MNDPRTAEPVAKAANSVQPKPSRDPAGVHNELLDYIDPRFARRGIA
jgi:hypothetical protein